MFIPRTFLCKKTGKVTPVSCNFLEIPFHKYHQPSITPANHTGITSCQRLHIASCPSMLKSGQNGNTFKKLPTGWFPSHAMSLRACDHRGASPLLLSPPMNGENHRFGKHLRNSLTIFLLSLLLDSWVSLGFTKKHRLYCQCIDINIDTFKNAEYIDFVFPWGERHYHLTDFV